jgi:hypothetical protein
MKARLAPAIKATGVPGFLLWARRDNPPLYRALLAQFPEVAEFELAAREGGLSGFSLSSIGSKLASSAKAIGTFVAQNAVAVASVAVPVIVAKKQADVAKAQARLAEAQMAPMQIAMDARGVPIPVQQYNGQWAAVPVQGGMIGTALAQGGPRLPTWAWAVGAGGAVLLLLALMRR